MVILVVVLRVLLVLILVLSLVLLLVLLLRCSSLTYTPSRGWSSHTSAHLRPDTTRARFALRRAPVLLLLLFPPLHRCRSSPSQPSRPTNARPIPPAVPIHLSIFLLTQLPRRWFQCDGGSWVVWVEVKQTVRLTPNEIVGRRRATARNADTLRECIEHLSIVS